MALLDVEQPGYGAVAAAQHTERRRRRHRSAGLLVAVGDLQANVKHWTVRGIPLVSVVQYQERQRRPRPRRCRCSQW